MIHRFSDSGNARHAKWSGIAAILSLMFVGLFIASSPAQAKTIFDDDWTPPKSDKPAQPPPPPVTPPATPNDTGKPEIPAAPPAQVVAPPVRRPIPPAADQAKSRKLFKEYYAAELADHSVAGRKALVSKLLAQASAVSDAPSDEFVLLVGATQASKEASDLGLLIGAADALEKAFEVDGFQVKSDAATQMSLRTDSPTETAENCRNGMTLVDQLAAAEDFTAALKLLKSLQAAAPDAELRKEIQRRAKEIDDLKTEADRIAMFMAKLKTSPDDLMANYNVGQHLCFVKGDWSHGLPFLAKGGEPTTKNLAAQELKKPADTDGIVALADGWWEYADTQHGLEKTVIQSHAEDYYRKALPELKGLAKLKVETRMAVAPVGKTQSATTVDLLTLDDRHRKIVSGDWSRGADGLQCDSGGRILFDYLPPEEYDIHVEYARLKGNDGVSVLCPLQHGTIAWNAGAYGNKIVGFMHVTNGAWHSVEKIPVTNALINGQRVVSTIRVRKNSAQGILNDKTVVTLESDGTGHEAGESDINGRRVIGISVASKLVVYQFKVSGVGSGRADITAKPPGNMPTSAIDNLLDRVDLAHDTRRGTWVRTAEGVAPVTRGDDTELEVRAGLPAEYDLLLSFTYTAFWHNDSLIRLRLPVNATGCQFGVQMSDHESRTRVGLWEGEHTLGDSSDTVYVNPSLQRDVRVSLMLKVRSSGIRAFLDGKLVYSHDGYDDLRQSKGPLEITAAHCLATFHELKVTDPQGRAISSSAAGK